MPDYSGAETINMNIREYQPSDYGACCELEDELAQYHAEIYDDPSIAGGDPGEVFDEYLARTDRVGTWVVESGGKVLGYAGLIDTDSTRTWESGITMHGKELKY